MAWVLQNVTKSVDLTASVLAASVRGVTNVFGSPGTLAFTVEDETGTIVIDPEDEIYLEDDGDLVFTGYCRQVIKTDRGLTTQRVYNVNAQDFNTLLDDDVVDDGVRSDSESDVDRITWLFDTFGTRGVTIGAEIVSLLATMPGEQDFTGMTLREAMTDIIRYTGGIFYVGMDRALHHFDTESNAAPFGLSDDPDYSDTEAYEDFSLPRDSVDAVNAVFVIGEKISTWRYTGGTPPAPGTRRAMTLRRPEATTMDELEATGDAYLARNETERLPGSLVTHKAGLLAGHTVEVTHAGWAFAAEPFWIASIELAPETKDRVKYTVHFGDRPVTLGETFKKQAEAIADIADDVTDVVDDVRDVRDEIEDIRENCCEDCAGTAVEGSDMGPCADMGFGASQEIETITGTPDIALTGTNPYTATYDVPPGSGVGDADDGYGHDVRIHHGSSASGLSDVIEVTGTVDFPILPTAGDTWSNPGVDPTFGFRVMLAFGQGVGIAGFVPTNYLSIFYQHSFHPITHVATPSLVSIETDNSATVWEAGTPDYVGAAITVSYHIRSDADGFHASAWVTGSEPGAWMIDDAVALGTITDLRVTIGGTTETDGNNEQVVATMAISGQCSIYETASYGHAYGPRFIATGDGIETVFDFPTPIDASSTTIYLDGLVQTSGFTIDADIPNVTFDDPVIDEAELSYATGRIPCPPGGGGGPS